MPIKRSAYVGETLGRLMKDENATREQLAWDFSLAKPTVSSIKSNQRTMPMDVAQESMRLYDNPEYIMDILHEFSSGYTSPVLRGKRIEQHRLSMKANVKREYESVLLLLEGDELSANPETLSTDERDQIRLLVDKLLDSRLHSDNFLKQLQVEYRISIKARMKALIPRWKALGWI